MNVTLYTRLNCSYCDRAKLLLVSKGISFTIMTLGEDFTREWLLETFPEVKTYPVVVVDDYNIGGYQQLNELLSRESKSSAKFLIEG